MRKPSHPPLITPTLLCDHSSRSVRPRRAKIIGFAPRVLIQMLQGEVGVSYFPRPVREIITEDKLTLVDRMYQPGDLLKRSVDDVRSGIVTGYVVESYGWWA